MHGIHRRGAHAMAQARVSLANMSGLSGDMCMSKDCLFLTESVVANRTHPDNLLDVPISRVTPYLKFLGEPVLGGSETPRLPAYTQAIGYARVP